MYTDFTYIRPKKNIVMNCPHPTDRKMRKHIGFFLFNKTCHMLGEEFAKISVFNGLKTHLYMHFMHSARVFGHYR